MALMMGTTLHSVAVGNLLPASVKTICVDINPAVVTKLTDRGTFQAIGLVTDVEPFLRELREFLADGAAPAVDGGRGVTPTQPVSGEEDHDEAGKR